MSHYQEIVKHYYFGAPCILDKTVKRKRKSNTQHWALVLELKLLISRQSMHNWQNFLPWLHLSFQPHSITTVRSLVDGQFVSSLHRVTIDEWRWIVISCLSVQQQHAKFQQLSDYISNITGLSATITQGSFVMGYGSRLYYHRQWRVERTWF